MALLRNSWSAPRSEEDRRRLAQASYNAGIGSLLKSQKMVGKNDYVSIVEHLAQVTGEANAKQTKTYVEKIQDYYDVFKKEAVQ